MTLRRHTAISWDQGKKSRNGCHSPAEMPGVACAALQGLLRANFWALVALLDPIQVPIVASSENRRPLILDLAISNLIIGSSLFEASGLQQSEH
jgi:hypothetical protein